MVNKIFLVLVDISGYTKFIKYHKLSLMHAEVIISELLESIINESAHPLTPHELEGDAVMFYALDDVNPGIAKDICSQVQRFIEKFKEKESELISDCTVCKCEACLNVDKLKLKAIIHYGEAAFTKVQNFQKVAGEDVILAHRLLKNTIKDDEYILLTEAFYNLSRGIDTLQHEKRTEFCEGVGNVNVYVYYPQTKLKLEITESRTKLDKLRMFFKLDGHSLKRIFTKPVKTFRHLE